MTVKELIEKPKILDQDAEITVCVEYGYGCGWDYANIENIEKDEEPDDSNPHGTYVIDCML